MSNYTSTYLNKISSISAENWFWSDTFHHWQKRNDRVYVYITPTFQSFKAQLYITGTTSMCELEVRTNNTGLEGFTKMLTVAEQWLGNYSSGNLEHIHTDLYSIMNGVWRDTSTKGWLI